MTNNKALADRYRINTGSYSRQLPSIVLLENGREVQRFPIITKEGKIGKVIRYSGREIANYFELEQRSLETREAKELKKSK